MLTEQRRELVEKIRELPARLRAHVQGLTDEQLTTHFLAGEWTVAQNVHHLADSGTTALEESLGILDGLHRRWVRLFESLDDADWRRAGLHPEIGEVTIDDNLRIYAAHGEGHIDQIDRTLAAQATVGSRQ